MNQNLHEEEEDTILPPSQKRIRASEPDLTVVVKGETEHDAVNGLDFSMEETFQYHSVILATQSTFFDALLDSQMKESIDKRVTLEEDPFLWEEAMEYIEEPLAARKVEAEDILKVAHIYDKYGFTQGMKLFEMILCEKISELKQKPLRKENVDEESVNLIIESTLLAKRGAAKDLLDKGVVFLTSRLEHGAERLTLDQLQKMSPLFADIAGHHDDSLGRLAFGWSDTLLKAFNNGQCDNELFPTLVHREAVMYQHKKDILGRVAHFKVTFEFSNRTIECPLFKHPFRNHWRAMAPGGRFVGLALEESSKSKCWTLICINNFASHAHRNGWRWRLPASPDQLLLPPETGWKRIDRNGAVVHDSTAPHATVEIIFK
jgi:hypothetical protein